MPRCEARSKLIVLLALPTEGKGKGVEKEGLVEIAGEQR